MTTPAAAVLLNPPQHEKLTHLAAGQLHALKTLNLGPATITELSTPDERSAVSALIGQLTADGWLTITVADGGNELYSILPHRKPAPRPQPPTHTLLLSKFAVLHRDATGFVLEHPMTWCDLRIHDARLLPLLAETAAAPAGFPEATSARFVDDLLWCGFLVADSGEDHDFESLSWSSADLWFHRRSTLGERIVTWEHFGPTKWAEGRFPQPPARRADYPGEPIELAAPDLAAARSQGPTLAAVVEDRVSTRTFNDDRPITSDELAELLYRTARTREVQSGGPDDELLSRPYPSAGGVYELELYPVIRSVAGMKPGMYHYDSFDHLLRPVADSDSVAVSRLVNAASATLAGGAEPQLLIVIAARCGRIMWTYEQIGYATVLKDVGVLIQTIYLVATAMGLGVCAQGFGDTAAFTAATGVSELQECSVGSIIVGSVGSA